MPVTIKETTDKAEIQKLAADQPPFGPDFSPDLIARAARFLHTGSSFSDPGGDWNKYELFDANGQPIVQRVVSGY